MDTPQFTIKHNFDDPTTALIFNNTGITGGGTEFPSRLYSGTSFETLLQGFKWDNFEDKNEVDYTFTGFTTAEISIKPNDTTIAATVIGTGVATANPNELLFTVTQDQIPASLAQYTSSANRTPIVLYIVITDGTNKISLETHIAVMDITRNGSEDNSALDASGIGLSVEQPAKWTARFNEIPIVLERAIDLLGGASVSDQGKVLEALAVQPGSPSDGDRYLATATAGDWTLDHIHEWNSTQGIWYDYTPTEGDTVYDQTTNIRSEFTTVWTAIVVVSTASDVPNVPAGNLIATDVQGALDELQTELDDLTAASIPNVPSGNLIATDLQGAVNELQTEIDNLPEAMEYKGDWNASTNTPTLIDGTGDVGDMYRVSVAGTQDLGSGTVNYEVGDTLVYDGTVWDHFSHSGGASLPVSDVTSIVFDPVDGTKQMRIDVGGVGTAQTRVVSMPDQDIDLTPGSGSFIKDIVSDVTPQLGGTLDSNSNSIDMGDDSDILNIKNIDFKAATELTISTGAITATQNIHSIDTQADASTDDLDTITLGTSNLIFIKLDNVARIVTLKDGTGNLDLDADVAMVFGTVYQLLHDGTNWQLVGSASTGGTSLPVVDTTAIVKGAVTDTKKMRIDVETNVTAATTRVLTMPDEDVDIMPQKRVTGLATTGTVDINFNAGNVFVIGTQTGNITLTFSNVKMSQEILIDITGSGAFTLTMPASVSIEIEGTTFTPGVRNFITIKSIDTATTLLAIYATTTSGPTTYEFLGTSGAISAAASVEFTTASWFDGTYNKLVFTLLDVAPATDAVNFLMTFSIDGGSTYLSTGIHEYSNTGRTSGGTNVNTNNAGATFYTLNGSGVNGLLGNATNESFTGDVVLYDPSLAFYKRLTCQYVMTESLGTSLGAMSNCEVRTTSAIDAVKFAMSSGNVATGEILVYGVR